MNLLPTVREMFHWKYQHLLLRLFYADNIVINTGSLANVIYVCNIKMN